MKTYARIFNGEVAELFQTDGDISTMFHPSLKWVALPAGQADVKVGWKYLNDVFTSPVVDLPPPEELGAMQARLATDIDNLIAGIYSKFSRFEREYTNREAAARAFIANEYLGDPGTYVTSFSASAGKTLKDAADLIIAQANALVVALEKLAAVRMEKYAILATGTHAGAQRVHDEIAVKALAIAADLK